MVIRKIQLAGFAEKHIDFFDEKKYVSGVGYIAATLRYNPLTSAATMPLTFPSQEELQGASKTPFDRRHGYKDIACPCASWRVSTIRIAAQVFRRSND